jgi:hypothetical protein
MFEEMIEPDKRFTIVYKQGNDLSYHMAILVDRETGVNYLFTKSGNGAGLTPLLDTFGNPVVSKNK